MMALIFTMMVTLSGSPPKSAIWSWIHSRASNCNLVLDLWSILIQYQIWWSAISGWIEMIFLGRLWMRPDLGGRHCRGSDRLGGTWSQAGQPWRCHGDGCDYRAILWSSWYHDGLDSCSDVGDDNLYWIDTRTISRSSSFPGPVPQLSIAKI